MENKEFYKSFFTEEQISKLSPSNYSDEAIAEFKQKGEALLSEVKHLASANVDPLSAEVQAIVGKCNDMIKKVTQNDTELEASLRKMFLSTKEDTGISLKSQLLTDHEWSFLSTAIKKFIQH